MSDYTTINVAVFKVNGDVLIIEVPIDDLNDGVDNDITHIDYIEAVLLKKQPTAYKVVSTGFNTITAAVKYVYGGTL